MRRATKCVALGGGGGRGDRLEIIWILTSRERAEEGMSESTSAALGVGRGARDLRMCRLVCVYY